MFIDVNGKEVTEDEVKTLFSYEDFLKETILKGHAGKLALKHLKEDTYKKIYVARPKKKEVINPAKDK